MGKIELALQTRLGFGLLDKKSNQVYLSRLTKLENKDLNLLSVAHYVPRVDSSTHERNKDSLSVKVGPQDCS